MNINIIHVDCGIIQETAWWPTRLFYIYGFDKKVLEYMYISVRL